MDLPSDTDCCPRCGGAFHCGVNDAAPCPCATLTLSLPLQASLRQRFAGCLCLRCLAELAQAGQVDPPQDKEPGQGQALQA